VSTSFNFPANPTLNQIVTLPDGTQAQWNGYAWVSLENNVTYPLPIPNGGTGATNPLTAKRNLAIPIWTLDDAAPAAPVYGDRWVRPGSMTEVVWMPNATNAGVWVNLADVGTAAYPIPINKGGTGATTLAQAQLNLGITNAAGQAVHPDGTIAAPGIAYASEPGLGFLRGGAGNVRLAALGSAVAVFDASASNGTYLSITPRATGTASVFLTNDPGANGNSLSIQATASTHLITDVPKGSGTAKPLNLTFPGGVIVTGLLTVGGNNNIQFGGGGHIDLTNASYPSLSFNAVGSAFVCVNSDQSLVWQKQNPVVNLLTISGVGDITVSGNNAFKNVAGQWAAASDVRIKERIVDYTRGLETILALRPREFSFRKATRANTTERHIGLIAQEAEMPAHETVTKTHYAVGDIELDDMRIFDPSPILYMMINAFKQIDARLKKLEPA
jgi:hypothetical protein